MRRTLLRACASACAAFALGAGPNASHGPVHAGTALRLDLQQLVDRSDLVLEGRVDRTRVVETAGGRIETELVLFVERTFWGEERAERVVRLPGGVLPDGRGLVLPGMPRARAGEELVLFLTEASPSGVRMPVGLAQGKLSVLTDLDGRRALTREPAGTTLVAPGGGHAGHAGREVLGYAETVAELHAAADRRRARGGAPAPEDEPR